MKNRIVKKVLRIIFLVFVGVAVDKKTWYEYN